MFVLILFDFLQFYIAYATLNKLLAVFLQIIIIMAVSNSVSAINIVSYNMHGFNQGYPLIENLINSVKPDVFLLQEHWLTPANLNQFDRFPNYFSFGSTAMSKSTEHGMLYTAGRLAVL